MRPPAPPACGLWQGFKKSGGSTGSKEHVCVSPSSIPRSASPRDKADTPPPASPISARPNTPPFWRFRRPSFSALCGRRRLRFLEAAAAFLELARGHLACAESICWRVCRFPENCGYGRCDSEEVSRGTQSLYFNTYVHVRTYKHTRTHACLHTYIHTSICTHAQLRARTCMRAVAVANRMLTIARCAKANARTHMHSYMHAYMHACMHACMHTCINACIAWIDTMIYI